MDYLRGYKVFRDDPQWTNKLMVGSVVALSTMFVPIVGHIALTGWQALVMRRARVAHRTDGNRADSGSARGRRSAGLTRVRSGGVVGVPGVCIY